MKKYLKILNLIDIPWNSGLTDYAIKQAKALQNSGHKIYFAAPINTVCEQVLLKEKFEIINISNRKQHFIFEDIIKMSKFVKSKGIDIINAHTGRTQTIAIISSFLGTKAKIIRTKSDASISAWHLLNSKISKYICASNFIKNNCLKGNFDEKKLSIIPPPAPDFNIPLPTYSTKMKIGILARLDTIKGHKYFLKAAAKVLNIHKECEFLIAGPEKNVKYSTLQNYAEKLGIIKNVRFLGEIANPIDFISLCDIGIISSIGSEAVSRVLLEWMAAARPVVATDVGCIPEILDNKYIVPPENSQILAEKIIKLINSKDEFLSAAIDNKSLMQKKYNITLFSQNTENEFLKAIYE